MSNYNTQLQSNNIDLQEVLEILDGKSSGVALPELSNEGSSSDLFAGKQLIDGDGNKITGTFTIDNELTTQDNLIAQIQNALVGKAVDSSGNTGGIMPLNVTTNGTYNANSYLPRNVELQFKDNISADDIDAVLSIISNGVESWCEYIVGMTVIDTDPSDDFGNLSVVFGTGDSGGFGIELYPYEIAYDCEIGYWFDISTNEQIEAPKITFTDDTEFYIDDLTLLFPLFDMPIAYNPVTVNVSSVPETYTLTLSVSGQLEYDICYCCTIMKDDGSLDEYSSYFSSNETTLREVVIEKVLCGSAVVMTHWTFEACTLTNIEYKNDLGSTSNDGALNDTCRFMVYCKYNNIDSNTASIAFVGIGA